jgi:hypothetical protein
LSEVRPVVRRDYTTLQVARKIAVAVLKAHDQGAAGDQLAAPVFRVLRETSTWFCHVSQDAHGVIDGDAPRPRLEDGR